MKLNDNSDSINLRKEGAFQDNATEVKSTDLVVLEPIDSVQKKKDIINSLSLNSPAVKAIIEKIDMDKPETLTMYGNEPAAAISASSDKILKEVEKNRLEASEQMILSLSNLVKRFNPDDFNEPVQKKGLIAKFAKNATQKLQDILDRYSSFGGELAKIQANLETFKIQRNKSNAILKELYMNNWCYYQQLQEYIYAGELCLNEIDTNILPPMREKHTNGMMTQVEEVQLREYESARNIFEKRIYDLKVSEAVFLQSLPTTQSIIYNNINLLQKYDGAFITTIPAFKNNIILFLSMKQQKHEANSMEMLDNTTAELMRRNANMAATQLKEITSLTERPAINPQVILEAWNTLRAGLEETEKIKADALVQRREGVKVLEQVKAEIQTKFKI